MKDMLLRELGRLVYSQQFQKTIFDLDEDISKNKYYDAVEAFHTLIEYFERYRSNIDENL